MTNAFSTLITRLLYETKQEIDKGNFTEDEVTKTKEIISEIIRKGTDLFPTEISQEAKKEFDKLLAKTKSTNKKIKITKWQDLNWNNNQTKIDPGRKKLHLEHMYPVAQLRDEICSNAKSENDVRDIFLKARVIWITKEENKKLDKIAKSYRPDPEAIYAQVGIKILNIP